MLSAIRLCFALLGLLFIAITPMAAAAFFADVPRESWFAPAVLRFYDAGYLEPAPASHPAEPVPRSEMIGLIIRLKRQQGAGEGRPATFDDVMEGSSFFAFAEAAAASGWLRGQGDCAGTHPCLLEPSRTVNRAETSAMVVRAYGISALPSAPAFSDAPSDAWYGEPLRAAASHCLLQGDDDTSTVRPGDPLNRAEMLTVLLRVYAHLAHPDCRSDLVAETLLPPASDPAPVTAPERELPAGAPATPAGTPAPVPPTTSPVPLSPLERPRNPPGSVEDQAKQLLEGLPSSSPADPVVRAMQTAYYDYVTELAYLVLQTKNDAPDTTLHVLDLLLERIQMIRRYNVLLIAARKRTLTADEQRDLGSLRAALDANLSSVLEARR